MTLSEQLLPSLVEKSRYPRRRMAALLLLIFLDHYQGSDQREYHHKNRYHFEICHDDHPLSFVKEGEKLSAIYGTTV